MKSLCLTNDMHNFCLPSVYKKKAICKQAFLKIYCLFGAVPPRCFSLYSKSEGCFITSSVAVTVKVSNGTHLALNATGE